MFLYAPLARLAKAALFCVNTQLYTVRRRASPLTREKRFWKCERCEVSATCLTHGHMLLYKTQGSNWGSVGDLLGILGGSMSEEGDPVAIMTHKNGGIQLVNFPLI